MTHEVAIEVDGDVHALDVREDEYVLDAALEAGLDLPYSCREGNCTTCTGELLAGAVDQTDGQALEPEDREEGYVLLCSATPQVACRIRAGEGVQAELLGLDLL